MLLSSNLSRRAVLSSAAGLAVGSAAISAGAPSAASAAGHGAASPSRARVFSVGRFTVATLLDGARNVPEPQNIFGLNVSAEEFNSASQENFIPSDVARFFFTPTLVDTGSEVVLFDTGLGGDNGSLPQALADAGYSPADVTIVVITHMHGDHVGGLMAGGSPQFPNARYITGSAEYNYWTGGEASEQGAATVANTVVPLVDQFTFIDDGTSVTGGITAMAAFGHTPGHMTYMIESDGEQLLLVADLANHFVWSLAYPDWEVRFDIIKEAAAASRRRVFGMLAADRIPFVGFHMPFPALGYVATRGDGFRYVPATYQFDL